MFHHCFLFHVFAIQLQNHNVIQKHTLIFHIKTRKKIFIKIFIFHLHQQFILLNQKKQFYFFLKTRRWCFNFTKKNVYQNFQKMI